MPEPTLDYARPTPHESRKLASKLVAWSIVCCLLVVALIAAIRWQRQRTVSVATPAPNAYCFIDSDVAGTEVFHRGLLLGSVPLKLSVSDLTRGGILPSTRPANESPLTADGWAEGLFIGDEDEFEQKLMLRVPDAVANNYLSIETPWGRRTKLRQHTVYSNGYRSEMWKTESGIRVTIDPLEVAKRGQQIPVRIKFENLSAKTYTGVNPQVRVHWGAFDTPWRRRTSQRQPLPSVMTALPPKATHSEVVTIEAPNVSGDYSLFVTWFLMRDETSDYGVDVGGSYSDSVLLRVR